MPTLTHPWGCEVIPPSPSSLSSLTPPGRPMRVLHLTTGNLFGGVEVTLITLAQQRALCPDMEPEFALCFPGRFQDELTAAAVPVHMLKPVRLSRPWMVWRGRRNLRRLL